MLYLTGTTAVYQNSLFGVLEVNITLKSRGIIKGINLGGWMSQCDYSRERLDNFVKENDIKQIADWGFDHVRLPIDYNIVQDNDGSVIEDGYNRIDKVVELCRKYGLKLVIDLHKTAGFSFDFGEPESGFFDNSEYQERFYILWEEIARRYGHDTDNIVFELLNEVTDESFIGKWNEIADICIERIRKIAPEVIILLGSYHNNAADTVQFLNAPHDDRIVYNFHCYEPLKFTHQGATWTPDIIPEERMRFEDSETSEAYFEELFSTAISTAEKYGTTLYCGEYGVIDIVSAEDSLKWFKVINKVFRKHGISRAVWNYKEMDFGISDSKYDGIREEILKYL